MDLTQDAPTTDRRPSSAAQGHGDLETVLAGLRAAGESTRLRIVSLLDEGELTVSELCRILGQTQPRVSRHLKLLVGAGLLDRHTEGTSAFYSPARSEPGRTIFTSVLGLIDRQDRTRAADHARLAAIRSERAEAAGRYFEEIAERWDGVRSLHVADDEVERALLDAAIDRQPEGRPIGSLLDIGTGTGRILDLFADRIDRGLGIDLSSGMLNLARTNLLAADHHHCTVRQGNVYALDVPDGSFDLAILHHVLHFLEDPPAAVAAGAAALRPGGQLLIVDFAPHELEELRSRHAHRRLGFDEREMVEICHAAGLTDVSTTHLHPPQRSSTTPGIGGSQPAPGDDHLLTVSLWSAFSPGEKS